MEKSFEQQWDHLLYAQAGEEAEYNDRSPGQVGGNILFLSISSVADLKYQHVCEQAKLTVEFSKQVIELDEKNNLAAAVKALELSRYMAPLAWFYQNRAHLKHTKRDQNDFITLICTIGSLASKFPIVTERLLRDAGFDSAMAKDIIAKGKELVLTAKL